MPRHSRPAVGAQAAVLGDRRTPGSFPGAMSDRTFTIRNARVGLRGPRKDVHILDGRVASITAKADTVSAGPVIEANGRTLLPGFWDAHVHAVQWACSRRRLDLRTADSAKSAAVLVRAHLSKVPQVTDGRIIGYGFRDALWPDAPHKRLLETMAPGCVVMLVSNDLHTAWLSPAALAAIGCGDHPTGVLREQACLNAVAMLEQVSTDELDRWVAEATVAAAERGVVGFTDFEYADNVHDWRRRSVLYELRTRIACSVYPQYLERAIVSGLRTGDCVRGSQGLLEVGPLKLFVDGSLNTRTAYCDDAYPGMGFHPDSHGVLTTPPDQLARVMRRGAEHGLQPALHAIGDRANAIALDAFEVVGCAGRIEHAQMVKSDDVVRFRKLGVIASVQPAHAPADRDVADRHWGGRTAAAFPYASLLAAGARLEIGSDAPVSPLDPWDGIAAAVRRTNDDRPPWHQEQAIPLEAAFQAACRGRRDIRVGDVADLVIVDGDPANVEAPALSGMRVFGTMLGGSWTYRSF